MHNKDVITAHLRVIPPKSLKEFQPILVLLGVLGKPGKHEGPNHQEEVKFLRLNSRDKSKAVPVIGHGGP
jgi:hypothetical protein